MTKRYTKYSTPLNIKEMQIKTTMKEHLTNVRRAITKKTRDKCWEGCGEKGNPSKGNLILCWRRG